MDKNNLNEVTNIFGVYPDITKEYILEILTQEQIIEKYTGIAVTNKTLTNNSVLSPFRADNNPTCNYWYNVNNKLRFRDWSGDFHGDCFDACARRLNLNANNKRDFIIILHTIAKDFKINRYQDNRAISAYNLFMNKVKNTRKTKKQLQFKIIPRKWNYHDGSYWYDKYRLTSKDLYYVYPAQEIYTVINDIAHTTYTYSTKDPAYCYYGGTKDGVDIWKVYFPLRRDKGVTRFISNSSFLQGKQLITCGRVCVITKSYKDVLCFTKYGIPSVAPSAESVILTKDEYFWLKNKFDFLVTCMDWDRAGIINTIKHRNIYGITPIMFTRGRFNSVDYGVKDFSDFVEVNSDTNVRNLIRTIYDRHRGDIKNLDEYYKQSIGWIQNEK